MKRSVFAIILLFLFAAIQVILPEGARAAGLCCQLSSGVQETLLGVGTPGERNISLQVSYSFTLMDKLREGADERSVGEIESQGKYTVIPTRMEMAKYTLTAAYGLSPKFSAFVSIPYLRNTMDMEMLMSMGMNMPAEWMEHSMEPVKGIGDLTVMGLYRLYTNNDVMPTETLTAGLGVKTPTGSHTKKSSSGNFIHAHMQPGTGSWDPLLSLIYAKMMNPFLLQADATYQITTRNDKGYKFGDSFAGNIEGKYAVSRHFNICGGLTYLHINRSSDREGNYTNLMSLMDDPANTGGESVWFSPGIQLIPVRNGVIDFKFQFPLWERVNGVQLVSSYRIVTALSLSF